MSFPVNKPLTFRITDKRGSQSGFPKKIILISSSFVRVPLIVRSTLFLFVFTLPLEDLDAFIKFGPLTFTKMSGYLFFASCLLYAKKCFSQISPVLLWFLVYLIIIALEGLLIPEEFIGSLFSKLFTITQMIFLFWVTTYLFLDENLARRVLLTFAIATVLLSVGTILHAPGFGNSTTRMTALQGNPNFVALLTACASVILLGLLLDKTTRSLWGKISLAVLVIPLLMLTVQTGSRAGVGALIIGFSLYLLPYRGVKQKMVRMIWAACTVAGIVYMVINDPMSSSRWEQAYEGNTAGRDEIFAAAIDMIAERPLLGWQPAVARYELGKRVLNDERSQDTHNLLLRLLLEGGIVGTLPFVVALWLCARAGWQARTGSLGMLPLALLATVLAYSIAHTNLTFKPFWLILALVVAAPSFVARGQKGRLVRTRAEDNSLSTTVPAV